MYFRIKYVLIEIELNGMKFQIAIFWWSKIHGICIIDEILMEWIKRNEAGVVWKADWRFQIYLNLWEVRSKI